MRRLCLVFAWIACLSLVGVPDCSRGEISRNLFHRRGRRAIDADRRSGGRVTADRYRLGRFQRARRQPHYGGRERRRHRPHRRSDPHALSLRPRGRGGAAREPHQDRQLLRSRPEYGSRHARQLRDLRENRGSGEAHGRETRRRNSAQGNSRAGGGLGRRRHHEAAARARGSRIRGARRRRNRCRTRAKTPSRWAC